MYSILYFWHGLGYHYINVKYAIKGVVGGTFWGVLGFVGVLVGRDFWAEFHPPLPPEEIARIDKELKDMEKEVEELEFLN